MDAVNVLWIMIGKSLRYLKRRAVLLLKTPYFKRYPPSLQCNICNWGDNRFGSNQWHRYTICPRCGSKIRQRLFWAATQWAPWLGDNQVLRGKRVLHFAPDKCLTRQIAAQASHYVTADLLATGYHYRRLDLVTDISNMSQVEDESFDCVIALDVLEHVPNYRKALQESNRVLALGGYCIFTVPQQDGLEVTYEDLSLTDGAERKAAFGQKDHWRIYGDDLEDTIAKFGFEVKAITASDIDPELVARHVLFPPVLSEHPFATNYRKVYFGKKIKHASLAQTADAPASDAHF